MSNLTKYAVCGIFALNLVLIGLILPLVTPDYVVEFVQFWAAVLTIGISIYGGIKFVIHKMRDANRDD